MTIMRFVYSWDHYLVCAALFLCCFDPALHDESRCTSLPGYVIMSHVLSLLKALGSSSKCRNENWTFLAFWIFQKSNCWWHTVWKVMSKNISVDLSGSVVRKRRSSCLTESFLFVSMSEWHLFILRCSCSQNLLVSVKCLRVINQGGFAADVEV